MKISTSNMVWQTASNNNTPIRILSTIITAAVFLVFIACPSPALAVDGSSLWGGGFNSGLELDQEISPHSVWDPRVASDGSGGAFAVWTRCFDLVPSTYNAKLVMQRIDALGNKLLGTGGAGMYVSAKSASHVPSIAADGANGLLVAWMEGRSDSGGYTIYAQRMALSGPAPWGLYDVQVSSSFGAWSSLPLGMAPKVVPDNIGGAFIGWDHRLAHIQPTGVLDAPGLDGIELVPGTTLGFVKMVSDGTGGGFPTPTPGGVFAAWSTAGGQLVAQRVKAGLQWGPAGLVVATHGGVLGFDLVPDGAGGVLLCWVATDGASPYRYTVRVQRLHVNGTKLWAPDGVIVVDSAVVSGSYTAPYYSEPALTSDCAGGAIIAWLDSRNAGAPTPPGSTGNHDDLYAQRLDANGTLLWNPLGILLPYYLDGQVAPGEQGPPLIVSDTHNGAVVAFDDRGGWDWDIAGTRLNGSGSKLWSQWIRFDGTSATDRGLKQRNVQITFDASGPLPKGAVLVWDEHDGGYHRIYAQKVEVDLGPSGPPANDDCSGAAALTEDVYIPQNTANATDDGWSTCLGRARTKGVWFTYTPSETGTATVGTCPSDFDTTLEIFTGTCGALTSIGCNDDSSSCVGYYQASVSFLCTAGVTYFICAGGYNGQSGNLQIRATMANLAQDGIGLLGTMNLAGVNTPVFHEGTAGNINDGDLNTRVDTWNATGTDPTSFVGILWPQRQSTPVLRLQLTLATFGDGGWLGPNNQGPGSGGLLSPIHLTEPLVTVTPDGGVTWIIVGHTSDYLTALNGHGIGGGAYPNPSSVTATFLLNEPASDINGIRIIGNEGGLASGGFLGVFELAVYGLTDADGDGMDDGWEALHGLTPGTDDSESDPDFDGLTNLREYSYRTDPQDADSDDDYLGDGAEVDIHHTSPTCPDTDSDLLNDYAETVYGTDPLSPDSDRDMFVDLWELQLGSDPNSATSIPANLALRMDAGGILGTMNHLGGTVTPVFFGGSAANINDGLVNAAVTTYNGPGATDPLSFVGILWANTLISPLSSVYLTLATYFDGGWFGPNNTGPGAGAVLSANLHLVEPIVQVTTDGGTSWTTVPCTSDYVAALDSHALPAVDYGPPTLATAHFTLTTAQTGINGVRILGSEGGTGSGGFLGVFELAALTRLPRAVQLLNPTAASGQFRFEFDSEAGVTYSVESALTDPGGSWQGLATITGDGTRKIVTDTPGADQRFYRVVAY